ncbi:MAG TPA: PAS domain S-box protein [Nitrospiraceae bacterium]|nr:PAS domain S-box protein [Nitrospiraceae bacterium]
MSALEQLLEVHEGAVIRQAEQLERTVLELRLYTEELTHSQQILREGEERYRLLFESNPHPMWVYDQDTLAFLAVNNAAVTHYGYARDEFLSMTIRDIRPPEDIPALMQKVAMSKEGLDVAGIWRHRKKDGTIIDVEVTSHTLMFGGRRAEVVLAHDVTERKRAEEALQASEERFKVFMNNNPAVAFMKEEDGRYVYVNEPLARLFQKSEAELIGKNDFEILPAEIATQLRENDRLVMAGDKVVELEESVPSAEGKLHHWMVFKFPFREASGRRLLAGMAIDITDRKQLEDQLRQAQKMEAIGRLAGGVAHDFNNLLTVISGYSELLQYRLEANETLHTYAEHIKEASDRATALTRQLLAFSRQQVLRPVVINLNRSVQDLMEMLKRLIGEHIQLTVSLAPEPAFLKADPGQIEQVLLNLVLNARDAMPDGGTLRIETVNIELDEATSLRLGTSPPGPYVQLCVADTGCGMDSVTQGRIFEPFFTTKDLGKGTGLGLATVYGIVTQSRGAITVESAPGSGARFTIYFPKSDIMADDHEGEQGSAGPVAGSETILVVEDQESVRGFLRNLLRLYGYNVLEASGGSEAISLCRQHAGAIQLLVTDVVMPGMSGRELVERVCAEQPGMKFLLISGYTNDPSIHSDVAEAGMPFLQKPFSPTALTHRIREVLDKP